MPPPSSKRIRFGTVDVVTVGPIATSWRTTIDKHSTSNGYTSQEIADLAVEKGTGLTQLGGVGFTSVKTTATCSTDAAPSTCCTHGASAVKDVVGLPQNVVVSPAIDTGHIRASSEGDHPRQKKLEAKLTANGNTGTVHSSAIAAGSRFYEKSLAQADFL